MAAPKLGILASVSISSANNDTALYAPSGGTPGRRAVVSTLLVVNNTTNGVTVRLYFRPAGAAAAAGNVGLPDINLPPNSAQPLTWGVALDGASGDAISCRASATGVNFFVFGNEEDIPSS